MFTDRQIANLKPGAKPYRQYEKGADRGFHIQVLPSGRKVWALGYTFDGRERFARLGEYPSTTLATAREACRAARKLVNAGVDPQADRVAKRESERAARETKAREERRHGTVAQLFDAYLAGLKRETTREQIRKAYLKDVAPAIGAMKARDVAPADVSLILYGLIQRGAGVQANRVRSYLSAAFRFGVGHDLHPANIRAETMFGLTGNPVRDVPRPVSKESVGERHLSAVEIAALWRELDGFRGFDIPASVALRLMLATGQRVKEVLEARWIEFDLAREIWELPSARTKNDRAHVVPIHGLAADLLALLRPITGHGALLFPNLRDANKPMPLETLSQAVTRYCARTGTPKFTPRDIRRTWKTRAGELGLSKEIRDRIQNHALDDVSSRHYDRYDYLPEKRRAMDAWGERLRQIIEGTSGALSQNVIAMWR